MHFGAVCKKKYMYMYVQYIYTEANVYTRLSSYEILPQNEIKRRTPCTTTVLGYTEAWGV